MALRHGLLFQGTNHVAGQKTSTTHARTNAWHTLSMATGYTH